MLADRKSSGFSAGEVLLNGEPRGPYFKRVAAYVMQFDALFETLTVLVLCPYYVRTALTILLHDVRTALTILLLRVYTRLDYSNGARTPSAQPPNAHNNIYPQRHARLFL